MSAKLIFGLMAWLVAGFSAHALDLSALLRPPAYLSPAISSSGRYLAVAVPVNGRMNVGVVDLKERTAKALTNIREFDVVQLAWMGEERIVFTLGNLNAPTGPERQDGGGLFVVSRDGKESRRLSPTVREARGANQFVYRGYRILRTLPDNGDELIVTGNLRDAESLDVYLLNVVNGKAQLLTLDRPPGAVGWVLDGNNIPRVAVSWVKDTLTSVVWYRADEKSDWVELTRYDVRKGPAFAPLAFDDDNRTLLVAQNAGRETMAIFRFDPDRKSIGEMIAQHPRYDIGANALGELLGGVITDPATNRVVGFGVNADKPTVAWIDADYARVQQLLDRALPDTFNAFMRASNGKDVLVAAYSDRSPLRWYLLDQEKNTLEELLASRPWLKRDQLVEMRPFTLKTRDGLEIPSYYFLPRDHKPGQRLPTVVHIHGGPTVRADFWGQMTFGVIEAQILAANGYAVVLPNFRGTPGLGSQIFYAGFGSLGRAMLEDHEDAAQWAVKAGFADPARICISGASYGGYAALMSLARFPSTFRCGVSGLMVSDWQLLMTSSSGDMAGNPSAVMLVNALVGASAPREYPKDISPVNLAEKIRQPVIIYAGDEDIRTPLEQTTAMVRALERSANRPDTVLIMRKEGHGFGVTENRIALYEQMLRFLRRTIGPEARP